METLPEPSKQPKKLNFVDQVSLGYVGLVELWFFESDFWFFGFDRVLLIPKHEAIIVKDEKAVS